MAFFPMLGLVAATALHGCDNRVGNRVEIPDFVAQMMGADVASDGRAHAQVRGEFRIDPTTAFCTIRPGYGLDPQQLDETLGALGQSLNYRNGQAGVSDHCKQGRPVFVLSRQTNNRLGSPYRLVLAVWQGEAACVAFLERSDGIRPGVEAHVRDIDLLNRTQNKQVREDSIAGDIADLTKACLARFSLPIAPPSN